MKLIKMRCFTAMCNKLAEGTHGSFSLLVPVDRHKIVICFIILSRAMCICIRWHSLMGMFHLCAQKKWDKVDFNVFVFISYFFLLLSFFLAGFSSFCFCSCALLHMLPLHTVSTWREEKKKLKNNKTQILEWLNKSKSEPESVSVECAELSKVHYILDIELFLCVIWNWTKNTQRKKQT